MSFYSENIFDEVLIKPLQAGADKLIVVSGYASANMVARHAYFIKKIIGKKLDLELIVGMCGQDGLELQNHKSFINLESSPDIDFQCSYITNRPPIHSKVYTWLKNGNPVECYTGSANYTQNAFSNSMREALVSTNPVDGFSYFNNVINESVRCSDDPDKIKAYIEIYNRKRIVVDYNDHEETNDLQTSDDNFSDLPKVTLTLLNKRNGEVPSKSGLNWGQRPEYNRNPNQAYINIPMDIGRSGFFPEKGTAFTIATDDDKQIICMRVSDGGKGLNSTLNNALIGEYFRYRLNLRNGAPVNLEDLLRYGRTDVDIYKIDEENYFMDFSV
jgi:hypothetical protein